MSRQNKKEAITALHHHTILLAAEQVFYEKGFSATTIEDLSKASSYLLAAEQYIHTSKIKKIFYTTLF